MSLEQNIFISTWFTNGFNAMKAYKTLHPDVTDASAAVLGCRMLRKVNIVELLAVYGLDVSVYIQELKEGLMATKVSASGVIESDYKVRQYYHQTLGKLLGVEGTTDTTEVVSYKEKMEQLREHYMIKS